MIFRTVWLTCLVVAVIGNELVQSGAAAKVEDGESQELTAEEKIRRRQMRRRERKVEYKKR